MPIYEYLCGNCGERVEVLIRSPGGGQETLPNTGGAPSCPQCGRPLLEKLFSAPNVISRWGQPSGGGTCCGLAWRLCRAALFHGGKLSP